MQHVSLRGRSITAVQPSAASYWLLMSVVAATRFLWFQNTFAVCFFFPSPLFWRCLPEVYPLKNNYRRSIFHILLWWNLSLSSCGDRSKSFCKQSTLALCSVLLLLCFAYRLPFLSVPSIASVWKTLCHIKFTFLLTHILIACLQDVKEAPYRCQLAPLPESGSLFKATMAVQASLQQSQSD